MNNSKKEVRSFELPNALYASAKKKAKESGLSFSAWVRTLIIKEIEPRK